jgi:DNA-binding GntR family transcriptional regulator
VVRELRRMILSGELLPGQQIRQESMAERLGVSRLPIREGLRQLTADGLVDHVPNAGFSVARLSQAEFSELYVMRQLLESETIRRIPAPTPEQLQRVIDLNAEVVAAAERLDLPEMRLRNHDFHFEIFRLSGLSLIIDEIERLWNWAAPYHAIYLYSADSRRAVLEEHEAMISALAAGNSDLLVELMNQHRHGSEVQLGLMLDGRPAVLPSDRVSSERGGLAGAAAEERPVPE